MDCNLVPCLSGLILIKLQIIKGIMYHDFFFNQLIIKLFYIRECRYKNYKKWFLNNPLKIRDYN